MTRWNALDPVAEILRAMPGWKPAAIQSNDAWISIRAAARMAMAEA